MLSFTGFVLFALIWWTVLFAVLPLGTKPVSNADSLTGWRGAPAEARMWRKIGLTTCISVVIWALCAGLIESGWLSFRHGILAAPENYP